MTFLPAFKLWDQRLSIRTEIVVATLAVILFLHVLYSPKQSVPEIPGFVLYLLIWVPKVSFHIQAKG